MAWADVQRAIEFERKRSVSNPKINDAAKKYLEIRDELEEMRRKHSDEQAKLRVKLEQYEDAFAKVLEGMGVNSFSCEAATIFRSTKNSATVADWGACLDFIRENEAWHLLEQRVNKTAALAIIEETAQNVPGVSIKSVTMTNVRRK